MRPEFGLTARVANIIAIKAGSKPDAIGLVAHYDSRPRGARRDGRWAGRGGVLWRRRACSRRGRTHSGPDGDSHRRRGSRPDGRGGAGDGRRCDRPAAGVPAMSKSIGVGWPPLLFEPGRGNALLGAVGRGRAAPRGRSYTTEIYKRLPNDTDFSIFKRQDIPGLNFAPVLDSYAYHTSRDTPERLSPHDHPPHRRERRRDRCTRSNGDRHHPALDQAAAPSSTSAARSASATDRSTGGIAVEAALVLGVVAWVRVTAAAVRIAGLLRWLLTFAWAAAGAVAVVCRDDRRDLGAARGAPGLPPVVCASRRVVRAAAGRRRRWRAGPSPGPGAGCRRGRMACVIR